MEDDTVDRFELALFLRWLIDSEGAFRAARRLGLAKGTIASLVGGLPVNTSSWATVELAYRKLSEAERQRIQTWFDTQERRVPRMTGTGRTL